MISLKTRVAVLRGGPSTGFKDSLKTGEHVLSVLRNMPQYEPVDIFISKDGEWHRSGMVGEPHRILRQADVVWNALHGSYGEDGQVQRILDSLGIPYTGSSAIPSMLALNKDAAKKVYRDHGIHTPAHILVTPDSLSDDLVIEIFRTYMCPVVVKPANLHGGLGVKLAHTFSQLKDAIVKTFEFSPRVLVEEYIHGDEVTCIVVERGRGERYHTLLPVSRHNDKFLHTTDNGLAQEVARRAHEALGLSHYSSHDMIVTPRKKVYLIETNTLPTFYEGSLVNKALEATGWKNEEFVDHCLRL